MNYAGRCIGLALMLVTWMFPAALWATDQADMTASLNALPLLINKITGDITIAVVYDPANPASVNDAQSIKKIVDNGLQLPAIGKFSALLVSANELGKLSRAQIAFLTPGLAPYFSDISTATSAASILTISTDIDCVKAAKCIIGVATKPATTIYYSKIAADAAKIEFSQSFTMVVKQF